MLKARIGRCLNQGTVDLLLHRQQPCSLLPATAAFTHILSYATYTLYPKNQSGRGHVTRRIGRRLQAASVSPQQASRTVHPVHLPSTAIGLVMGSASNYVRVELEENYYKTGTGSSGGNSSSSSNSSSSNSRSRLSNSSSSGSSQGSATNRDCVSSRESACTSAARPQLLCNLRGLLKKMHQNVLVGDRVVVGNIDWQLQRAVVEDVLERHSELSDPAVANVDHIMLLFALDRPPFEEQQVTRFLVSAEASGLPFSLVLNKTDLVDQAVVDRRVAQCRSWGYEPLLLSCERGSGVEAVASVLPGRTSVVAGPSGSGKSSLINALRLGRHRPDLQPFASSPAVDSPPELAQWQSQQQQVLNGGSILPRSVAEAWRDYERGGGDTSAVSSGSRNGSGSQDEEQKDAERTSSGHHASSSSSSSSSSDNIEQHVSGDRDGDDAGDGGDGSCSSSGRFLEPGSQFLAVGEMSRIGRGKHTTTSVTLIRLLGGGCMADTPGFGVPTLDGILPPELAWYFPEFQAATEAKPCRFSNCLHVNEPGCTVTAANFERYGIYLKFLAEIQEREEYDVKVLQMGKKEREGATKVKAGKGGRMRVEAKLDQRKHRLVSRQKAKLGLLSTLDEEEQQ